MIDAPGLDNSRLVSGSSRLADVTFDWCVVGFTPTITLSSAVAFAWRLCGVCSDEFIERVGQRLVGSRSARRVRRIPPMSK
jgi:hypothetical protein